MARLAGYGGSVSAPAGVNGIKSWTVDYHFDALDGTGFDSSARKVFTPGISEWSGSFEGFKNQAPLTIGTEIALELLESAVGTQKHTGQAIITDFHGTTSVDGLVAYSYDFQGTAAFIIATT